MSYDIEGGNRVTSDKTDGALNLYKTALRDDWERAERIYKESGKGYDVRITPRGETALHVAALAGHINFVERLVEKMGEGGLAIHMESGTETADQSENGNIRSPPECDQCEKGNTALHCAALSGNVNVAKAILKKNSSLALAKGNGGLLPIHSAALKGNKEMVRHLYEASGIDDKVSNLCETTKRFEEGSLTCFDLRLLLLFLIHSDIYDVACRLAKALIHLNIVAEDKPLEEEALDELAQKPLSPPGFWNRYFFPCRHREDKNLMCKSGIKLVKLLWDKLVADEDKVWNLIKSNKGNFIIEAAKQGNVKFLAIVISLDPRVLFCKDENEYTIFHHAILNRQEEIFNWIHIGSIKTIVTTFQDKQGNNMLHLAGRLAPSNRLNIVPGAALQLKRELIWFEEVKNLVQRWDLNLTLMDGNEKYTPNDIFVKEHEELRKSGEIWMKDTANSCMIVAALITTVVFAAAFTIPRGSGDNGNPIFLHQTLFKVFAISDAISLISSVYSLLNFLSIHTSRYTIDDFCWSLPNTLLLGLASLFLSIVAMMVTFVTTFFILFKNGPLLPAKLIAAGASLPIFLFIQRHLRLIVDVFRSTYTSMYVFKPNKNDIFLIKDEEKKGKFSRFC